ncbi:MULTISPECIES: AlkA N-terminal domain-containing protein [unclassified Pseudofrankia]|uniref:AlkA N-terminal domain-containing protein n=1 Tax=unclassified Pseudofrankia TaxID=2994372 RepID=UPI0008DA73BF|nr:MULTISPECIES: AlkA N-terminal domain-containing protein [unclassified Pseudofrankia]MDT3441001.1 AlkA N-terminal domain-containing protein [Pseudofrankia sp. BMG5.37]OHV45478.1 DNA-3-methyladenine glycosylase [Pseudofrankia sp. BMG5.36]
MDLDFDVCFEATRSRDARFDGWFIVGVHTTGVYCRPSCPSPVCPKPVNVTFYRISAAAQLAGLRACKRCRPDAVPGSPDWNTRADLVGRAMRLIADGVVDREGVPGLAGRLAVSSRHLHRVLVEGVGAPPLALARSRRAYQARLLVETTGMPFGEIAFAAGFASIRQFNDTLREVFAATPSQLRAARRRDAPQPPGVLMLRLPVRVPYDPHGVLGWLAARAVPGVEDCPDGEYRRVLRLPGGPGTVALRPAPDHVQATFRLASVADLGAAVARCRRLLDLDADPRTYLPVLAADPALAPLVEAFPGLRLPCSVDGAETALRAVLGPQAAAVATLGASLAAPDGRLTHAFPEPAAVAAIDPAKLGLPMDRGRTLRELARRLATGELVMDEGVDRAAVRHTLLAVPGLGPALVDELALYGLGDPNAFPAGDSRLRAAARQRGLPGDAAGLARYARRWRPWRGYAAHLLRAGHTVT